MNTVIEEYLDYIGVTVESRRVYDTSPKWAEGMQGYTCILMRNGERMFSVPFYTGPALQGAPTRQDVLSALFGDRQTIQYSSEFEEWADRLGYNADSINDKQLFDALIAQTAMLESHLTAIEILLLPKLMED